MPSHLQRVMKVTQGPSLKKQSGPRNQPGTSMTRHSRSRPPIFGTCRSVWQNCILEPFPSQHLKSRPSWVLWECRSKIIARETTRLASLGLLNNLTGRKQQHSKNSACARAHARIRMLPCQRARARERVRGLGARGACTCCARASVGWWVGGWVGGWVCLRVRVSACGCVHEFARAPVPACASACS